MVVYRRRRRRDAIQRPDDRSRSRGYGRFLDSEESRRARAGPNAVAYPRKSARVAYRLAPADRETLRATLARFLARPRHVDTRFSRYFDSFPSFPRRSAYSCHRRHVPVNHRARGVRTTAIAQPPRKRSIERPIGPGSRPESIFPSGENCREAVEIPAIDRHGL